MKNSKYLTQLIPAVAMTALAAFGFQQSTPVFESLPLTTTAEAVNAEDSGTGQETEEQEQAVGDYTDGTYTGTGIGYRGEVKVEVTVAEKQITDVSVLSYSDDESFFNRAKTLIDSIIQQQTWEVDSVSGATYSSRGIKEAVENALTGKASTSTAAVSSSESSSTTTQTEQSLETPEGGYTDGTYTGSAQGFGGTITVKVTVASGKISAIEIVSASGETASYFANAKQIISKMLSSNSPNVDTISGATISSTGIKNAVINALKQASGTSTSSTNSSSSSKKKVTVPSGKKLSGTYNNGTYTGTGTGWGGEIKVKVTIKNNQMTKLSVVSAKKETESFFEKAKEILDTMITKQTANVDAASGATYSSNGLKEAVKDALNQAKATAKTQTITTTQDTYTVTEGDDAFSLGAKAKTSLSYKSSDKSVVTVNKNGKVTIVGAGDATITIKAARTTKYKAATKKVSITVLSADSKVETYTGTAVCTPDSSGQFEEYTLSMDVTFVDGKATAISEPVMTPHDDSNASFLDSAFSGLKEKLLSAQDADQVDAVSGATCSSNAIKEAFRDAVAQQKSEKREQTITTDESSYTLHLGDEAAALNAKAEGELTYASDNEDVVTVDAAGNIAVVGKGTATVTITAAATDDYKQAVKEIPVTVTGKVQTITAEELYSVNLGEDPVELKASVNREDGKLTYASEDEKIATVSEDGKVTPVAAGTTKIVITAAGDDTWDEASKTVVVTVVDPSKPTEKKRNGTYTGKATVEPDEDNDFEAYTMTMKVTFTNGVVTEISDLEYTDKSMKAWMETMAFQGMKDKLIETQTEVDAVSGATCSSKAINEAFLDACAQADADLGD